MKRSNVGKLVCVLIAFMFGAINSVASADTYTCTSVCTFGPEDTLDNLTVKNGGFATLDGTLVTGNVVVEDGGKLILKNGVEVEGSVQSFGATLCKVKDTFINGSLQIKKTKKITVENVTINGDLQLETNKIQRSATIRGCLIGGNMQLYKNRIGTYQILIAANEVHGNLQLVDNRDGTIVVEDNYVESSIQCTDNTSLIAGSGNEAGDIECPDLQ